jgi:hypothetical protein
VNDRCFDKIAQIIVNRPIENGSTRSSFRLRSIFAFSSRGSGMLMISRSELKLKEKFVIK